MSKLMANEEFIRAWQSAPNMTAFLEQTGLKKNPAAARASRLRKHGVPLKSFARKPPGPRAVDWDELAKLAKDALPE